MLRFLNPHNSNIEAIKMHANLVATAKFELLDGFRITGEIQDLQLTTTEFKCYFKSSVTKE